MIGSAELRVSQCINRDPTSHVGMRTDEDDEPHDC